MSTPLVTTSSLGLSVFGTAQVSYTVDGQKGMSYDYAVAMTGLKRAVAVENAVPAYEAAVKARVRRLEDLGNALASIATAVASVNQESKHLSEETASISAEARDILNKYGLGNGGTVYNFFDLQKLQTEVQYQSDVTDNDVQQDASMLQSLVSKRDSAYQMASKLMKKATKTFTTGVRYIG